MQHHLELTHQRVVETSSLTSLPRWFSIVMYLAFLIAVLVVLLNVLIAQMSNTYNEIEKNVDGAFAIARARIISRLQKERWPICKGKVKKIIL